MDRLSDFKLATDNILKRIGTAQRRAASSCNAFAIATFSSSFSDCIYRAGYVTLLSVSNASCVLFCCDSELIKVEVLNFVPPEVAPMDI